MKPSVESQLDLLMRGTLFADEVETGEAKGVEEQGGEPRSSLRLRDQMRSELAALLKEDRPLRVYLGVDPTAPSLHIGHLVPVLKLRQFQDLGHHVVFLIGDYTGLIGDPSGREDSRKQLDSDTLKEMARGYTDQVFRILDPEKTEIRRNSEWLGKLGLREIIELASLFPLKQIVSRRDFRNRMERGESLRFHEALYALMQGYDAFALECDLQVGGYDQHFNLLAGRIIQAHFGQRPHVMVTVPLLPGTDGRKMSKSFANTIDVEDRPEDMYGKVMRLSDPMIPAYLDSACLMDPEEITRLKTALGRPDTNPMEIKKKLALEVTRLYHGDEKAEAAQGAFERISQQRMIPKDDEIPVVEVPESMADGRTAWSGLLADLGLVASRGAAKRLMEGGGFKVEGKQVRDREALFEPRSETLIQYGKRSFARLVLAGSGQKRASGQTIGEKKMGASGQTIGEKKMGVSGQTIGEKKMGVP